ncbi:antiviral reverse transcriptase Drt2 [Collimonas humicola]|uniref:antiviral reverse transcriptase Drt2 n=1 Tax=Collimonas humicola TaxID=2825886 RepID=UPI001B8D9562|nr:antiviral reverse transcriptase Drt2 [Collimonas humicola]
MSNRKHPWFRHRGYPHFDHPISFREAKRIVKDPEQVARHSFYPFVEFSIQTFKVKRNKITDKVERVGKTRPIAYASHVDCHIYSYYAFRISKLYEKWIRSNNLDESVLAFRSLGKSNVHFAANAFDAIRKLGNCYVVALDITGFFDNLDHKILKNSWADVLDESALPPDHYAVFKSLTKFATVNKGALYEALGISLNNHKSSPKRLCTPEEFRETVRKNNSLVKRNAEAKGIPQGSPISALLSNIYMRQFDIELHSFASNCGGFYFRYCDDILLIVPPVRKDDVEGFAMDEIAKLNLPINPTKTDRVSFEVSADGQLKGSKPLQYLGFLFDGQRVILRSASLARYSEKMRRGVRIAKATMAKRNSARIVRGDEVKPLFRRKLNSRYTYLGRRNFITYGYAAARVMDSQAIRKQLRGLWQRLNDEIDND